ncbi:MAG: ComF family protein [Balneolaceae bacterium]
MISVLKGIREFLFPKICACCSDPLAEGELSLCEFCKSGRFEPADSRLEMATDEILPGYVAFRMACWQLDPGGTLQDLIYRLKYGHLYDLGIDLGGELGKIIYRKATTCGYTGRFEPVLVPVPLHRSRQRERGYNQAAAICEGMKRITGWNILDEPLVRRTCRTRTQTGLTAEERIKNMSGAFCTGGIEFLPYELPVIVDDVFTTGATVRELSLVLRQAGAQTVGIATLTEV